MDSREQFDVVVIGAGLGGLSVAALLTQKEHRRVLVVEREEGIGGRIHHFKGSELKTPEDYLGPLAASTGWLVRSEPDLPEIIDSRVLEGYSFELGMHDIVNGAHSRMCHLLEALGVPVEVVPLKACGFWQGEELHELKRGSFPWMDLDTYKELRGILGQMVRMPVSEVRSHYRESLSEFVQTFTENPEILDFFDILGAFTVGMNSARELSAGEFMLITRMPMAAGLHFADGTLGQMGGESFMEMAHNLASIVTDGGGQVRTGQRAEQIQLDDGCVTGVTVSNQDGEVELISSGLVISNVPISLTLDRLLPGDAVPLEFVEHVRGLRSSGAFVPIFGLERSVIDIPGMLMAKVPIDDPALPDGIVLGYEAHSLFVEGKAPGGKEIIECWVGLDTQHLRALREAGKMEVVADAIRDFMVSVAPTPAQAWDSMLDPRCPGVEGLYFVGDSVKNYGGFMDGVAYTALLCASAVTGNDYLGEVLPPYQREL
jgi:protoporphyrinogen oxidase